MICDHCKEIFQHLNHGGKWQSEGAIAYKSGRFRTNEETRALGSEEGCYICLVLQHYHCDDPLRSGFRARLARNLRSSRHRTSSGLPQRNWRFKIISLSSKHGKLELSFKNDSRHKITLGISREPVRLQLSRSPQLADFEYNQTQSPYATPTYTGHLDAIQLARSWLEKCIHSHKTCDRARDPRYLPPRLLCLRKDRVRLITTAEPLQRSLRRESSPCPDQNLNTAAVYATLSHCWGPNPKHLKLSTGNIKTFEAGVKLSSLPRTFRDALMACKQMGLQYLWIDSLCILQDGEGNKDDWLKHVKAMTSIYRNGLVNLAADLGAHSDAGLFNDRHIDRISSPRVHIRAGLWKGPFLLFSHRFERQTYGLAPLDKRGWVLQERVLSPRILHFGEDQLRWECAESRLESERYPDGLPDGGMWSHAPTNFDMYALGSESRYSRNTWHLLVSDFTNRQLTYPHLDKLAAFSSIAENYSAFFNERYIAGFLETELPHMLTWTVNETVASSPSPPKGTYRSPSWSWAKVDTTVSFPYLPILDSYQGIHRRATSLSSDTHAEPVVSLFELSRITSYQPKYSDPANEFGQLSYAEITLIAPISTCTWICVHGSNICHCFHAPHLAIPYKTREVRWNISFDSIEEANCDQRRIRAIAVSAYIRHAVYLQILLVRCTAFGEYERVGAGNIFWHREIRSQRDDIQRINGLRKEELFLI